MREDIYLVLIKNFRTFNFFNLSFLDFITYELYVNIDFERDFFYDEFEYSLL
jgi:hypothetical protein